MFMLLKSKSVFIDWVSQEGKTIGNIHLSVHLIQLTIELEYLHVWVITIAWKSRSRSGVSVSTYGPGNAVLQSVWPWSLIEDGLCSLDLWTDVIICETGKSSGRESGRSADSQLWEMFSADTHLWSHGMSVSRSSFVEQWFWSIIEGSCHGGFNRLGSVQNAPKPKLPGMKSPQ